MKVIKKDFKNGLLKVEIENLDDIWHLSHIISVGDKIKSRDSRKIKIGDKVVKKTVVLLLGIVKVELGKNYLRVSGKVVEGTEEVPKGSMHSFSLESGVLFELRKSKFLEYQKQHVREAMQNKPSKVLVCVLDRSECGFAVLKKYGYDYLGEISGEVEKKYKGAVKGSDFYLQVVKQIEDYVKRFGIERIIVGSAAFWKDELAKKLKGFKSKVVLATCNNVGRNGVDELLKREEIRKVLSEERVSKEVGFVEDLLKEISKDGLGSYGFKEVSEAVLSGAVSVLLVTDKFLYKKRDSVDDLMKKVERSKGSVHVVSIKHDGGKKLDGLGGIGAILRYKV